VPGCHVFGHAEFESGELGPGYRLDAEVTIPLADFEPLGLDPKGGFDDEEVVLAVEQQDIVIEMTRVRIAQNGVTFAAFDTGTGLTVREGDAVAIRVHARQVATGRF
jgi:hypothetical protein